MSDKVMIDREQLEAMRAGIVDFRMDHPHIMATDGLDRAEELLAAALAPAPAAASNGAEAGVDVSWEVALNRLMNGGGQSCAVVVLRGPTRPQLVKQLEGIARMAGRGYWQGHHETGDDGYYFEFRPAPAPAGAE